MQFADFLHWRGKSLVCDLPKGLTSCINMFYGVEFPEGFRFRNFNTSNVECMIGMFREAKFGSDFSLGDRFNTKNVVDCTCMFYNTKFNKGFTLGDNFYLNSCDSTAAMFYGVEFTVPDALGKHFDVSNVSKMVEMFEKAKFCKGFTLGDKFTPYSCEVMSGIFAGTIFNDDFMITGKSYVGLENRLCADPTVDVYGHVSLFSEETVLPKSIRAILRKDVPIVRQERIILFCMHEEHEGGWQYDMWGTLSRIRDWAYSEGNMTRVYDELSQRSIDFAYFEDAYWLVYGEFADWCNQYLKNLFSSSSVTIGEAIKRIQEKDIPDDVIYKCTCEYLSDQVVVEDYA